MANLNPNQSQSFEVDASGGLSGPPNWLPGCTPSVRVATLLVFVPSGVSGARIHFGQGDTLGFPITKACYTFDNPEDRGIAISCPAAAGVIVGQIWNPVECAGPPEVTAI